MLKVTETITRFFQGTAVALALGMLTAGLWSHQESTDLDEDGILDNNRHDSDGCPNESYESRYHATCLTDAGLELPRQISCSDAWNRVKELGIDPSDDSVIKMKIEEMNFEEAAIRTCRDLRSHKNEMRDLRNDFRWSAVRVALGGTVLAALAGLVAGGWGSVPVVIIASAITALLWVISNKYGEYRISADNAEYELCGFRR